MLTDEKTIAQHLHMNDALMLLTCGWLHYKIHVMPRSKVAADFLNILKELLIQFKVPWLKSPQINNNDKKNPSMKI